MGYGGGDERDASEHLGGSGDGGVDGVINQDVLGLDRVYLQAKRWKETVGVDRIYAFAGSLEAKKATKGVILTPHRSPMEHARPSSHSASVSF
jgi:restriction system protein